MSNKEDDLISALRAQTEAITAQTDAINRLIDMNQAMLEMLVESQDEEEEGFGFLDDDDEGVH